MSIVSVQPKSFILALFIRDDNERFLLGDNGYDFKDSQLHFAANTIENDEVQKQGADGVMIAGQVRRASVQSFDGFVGDATMAKETIEQMRRDFIAFFLKGHHYRVIYVDCNRNAWQRKGGYLVDAPEVKELWQIHPEYHVGLNFEDVNYYSYDEDADGNEILANLVNVPVSTEIEGGLVWDEDGAVSEEAGDISYDEETADATPAKNVYITDATEAPLASFQLDGETSQNGTPTPSAPVAVNTTTGENVVKICGKNLFDSSATPDYVAQQAWAYFGNGTYTAIANGYYFESGYRAIAFEFDSLIVGQQYTLSFDAKGNSSHNAQVGVNMYSGASGGTQKNYTIETTSARISFTFTATSANRIAFNSGSTSGADLTITNIQLELGNQASAYEPYKGQSYEVDLASKNILDIATLTYGYVLNDGGFSSNHPLGEMRSGYIKVAPSTKYTFSIVETSSSYESWFGIGEYSAYGSGFIVRKTQTTSEATSITFTTSANCQYVVLSARNLEAATKVQFEKGLSPTSWETFWQIELCKIGTYQDYIYKSGDKWYVHKEVGKYQLDGTEVWGTATDGYILAANSQSPFYNILALGTPSYESLCSHFYFQPNAQTWTGDGKCGFNPTGTFWVMYAAPADKNAFLAWLGQTKPSIYFPLATLTDTEITNATLIAQLDNVAAAPLYTGVNNITTITPNEQGTLEISYYTKYQPMIGSGGYVWEAGGAGGPTVIINNSIDNVSPVWTIYGPTTNPQLEDATTGETIEYVGTIAQGQTLTIDMGEQTASLDGLNVISNLVGDFVQLAPGRNNIIYSVSGEAGASELGWSEIVG